MASWLRLLCSSASFSSKDADWWEGWRHHDQARNKSDRSFNSATRLCSLGRKRIDWLPLFWRHASKQDLRISSSTAQSDTPQLPLQKPSLKFTPLDFSLKKLKKEKPRPSLKRPFREHKGTGGSHRCLRCPKSPRRKPGGTTPGSHLHPPTSTVGRERQRGGETWRAWPKGVELRRRWVSVSRRSVPHSCWCPGVSRWYEGYWTDPGTEPWGEEKHKQSWHRD